MPIDICDDPSRILYLASMHLKDLNRYNLNNITFLDCGCNQLQRETDWGFGPGLAGGWPLWR